MTSILSQVCEFGQISESCVWMQEWMDDTIIHNLTKEEEKKRFQNSVVHFIFHVHPFFSFFFHFVFHYQCVQCTIVNCYKCWWFLSYLENVCVRWCLCMCVRGREDYFILKQNILQKRLHTSSSNKEEKQKHTHSNEQFAYIRQKMTTLLWSCCEWCKKVSCQSMHKSHRLGCPWRRSAAV